MLTVAVFCKSVPKLNPGAHATLQQHHNLVLPRLTYCPACQLDKCARPRRHISDIVTSRIQGRDLKRAFLLRQKCCTANDGAREQNLPQKVDSTSHRSCIIFFKQSITRVPQNRRVCSCLVSVRASGDPIAKTRVHHAPRWLFTTAQGWLVLGLRPFLASVWIYLRLIQ